MQGSRVFVSIEVSADLESKSVRSISVRNIKFSVRDVKTNKVLASVISPEIFQKIMPFYMQVPVGVTGGGGQTFRKTPGSTCQFSPALNMTSFRFGFTYTE